MLKSFVEIMQQKIKKKTHHSLVTEQCWLKYLQAALRVQTKWNSWSYKLKNVCLQENLKKKEKNFPDGI